MKLSTINWLSRAIALPLFISGSNILPAVAAPVVRSQRISFESSKTKPIRSIPSATDLNLKIPFPAAPIVSEGSEPGNAIAPIWANPDRPTATIAPRKQQIKTKFISIKKDSLTLNLGSNRSLENSRQGRTSLSSKQKNLGSRNIDTPALKSEHNRPAKHILNRQIAAISRTSIEGSYLRLIIDASKGKNSVGNPIYTLETYINGRKFQSFNVVSGTANTQKVDRDRGNNFAPLPDGLYDVSDLIIPGKTPEVGRTFISIFPKFETNRNELGIHLDPSFNKGNGYDGTAGCIGMIAPQDRDAINKFVTKYRPRNLFVNIMSPLN
ncbi:hypothetical protein [Chamaesiphon sp. VAR_48_metabat_403]|uniref:hypothetical protein n=1 Tax=Chamaesiphon sp. VAR_48_metabat_403 TaxID=2964700 RepID=UPI00286E9853|nr:hypothetical protein [Chamaesiphon sp. VAR_48_metabat_403]